MSDKMRWRYGDTNPVVAAVDSATVVEIGDAVYLDTDDAKPAGSLAWSATIGETQDAFADKFLGIAMQRSKAGETTPIRVATTGVFELDCAAATFELGGLVGLAKAAGNALEPQKAVAVTDSARAIGRVAKREAASATSVLVDIKSAVMAGGVQNKTSSGS